MKKKTLGSVLKDRREFLRLTQRELAAKLGVKASHVAYLENGRQTTIAVAAAPPVDCDGSR